MHAVLRAKPRVLCMLRLHSTNWATFPVPLSSVLYFHGPQDSAPPPSGPALTQLTTPQKCDPCSRACTSHRSAESVTFLVLLKIKETLLSRDFQQLLLRSLRRITLCSPCLLGTAKAANSLTGQRQEAPLHSCLCPGDTWVLCYLPRLKGRRAAVGAFQGPGEGQSRVTQLQLYLELPLPNLLSPTKHPHDRFSSV